MKSVLIVEDNKLVLEITSSALKNENLTITKSTNAEHAIKLMQANDFDLVITDLYMGHLGGLDLIDYVRSVMQSNIPIMVLSGEESDDKVIEALQKGANDYVLKPVSIGQLIIRTKKLLGIDLNFDEKHEKAASKINRERVGVVIPCYNEADRLATDAFQNFLKENTSYTVCFVNDGSTDNTLELLQEFQKSNPNYIQLVNLDQNSGKAEAVRQGVLALHRQDMFDYIGFLDADLSTDFTDMKALIDTISTGHHIAVIGSRISRVGAKIHKESSRAIVSRMINKLINTITLMPFQDTQCGAKIFDAEVISLIFDRSFKSKWLFDVEIFIRLRDALGKEVVQDKICEYPLRRWVHVAGSKLGFKDSVKILFELLNINKYYSSKELADSISSNYSNSYHRRLSQI